MKLILLIELFLLILFSVEAGYEVGKKNVTENITTNDFFHNKNTEYLLS
jgi:hypothetical protein